MKDHRSNKWVTNKDLAQHLGISVMTLYRWQNEEKLSFPKPAWVLDRPRTNIDDVDLWMEARRARKAKDVGKSKTEAAA